MPYLIDGLVIALIVWLGIQAYRRGFVLTVLGFLPMVAGFVATKLFTPVASRLLRETPFFGSLSDTIAEKLHLEELLGNAAMQTQTDLIQNMHLPSFLKESLLENNNPVIYDLLNVESMQGYISGFLANICINIVSTLLVFVIAFFAAKFVLRALNLISKLPVLNTFNRICGFLVGVAKGLCVVWLWCFALTLLQCNAGFQEFFKALQMTKIALPLYENNLLIYFILTIFT